MRSDRKLNRAGGKWTALIWAAGPILLALAALGVPAPLSLGAAVEDLAEAFPINKGAALLPPMRDGKPVEVKLGFYVTNLVEVDEVRERFSINGYLSEIWRDPRLVFKSQGADSGLRRIEPGQLWMPDLLMINTVSPRRRISVNIKVTPDGDVHYLEEFQAELSTDYVLQSFPFDRQSLEVVIQPFLDESDTVTFTMDQQHTGISPDLWVPLAQWEILGVTGLAERTQLAKTSSLMPEFQFKLSVKRRYWFYLWKVFLPLLIMVLVSYGAFCIKIEDQFTQATFSLTALLTEIAFLFAISSSLPRIPYLTYIDAFFLISFFFSFLSMVELLVVHQAVESDHFLRAQRIRRFSRWLYLPLYLLSNVVLVLLFISFQV